MRRLLGLVVVLLCLVLAGCGEDPASRPADWGYLHAAVIEPACTSASCHSSLAKTGGVVLDDADSARRTLLEAGFVRPGDPNSPLLYLLRGDERQRMPPDAPLPRADVELVQRWIEGGAQP
ncbi:MAG: hypothetical protein IT370_01370 [Deltaproteobacteria bacterium]|nr:hypothetical protein [Deltaproteobacteria bacterium]